MVDNGGGETTALVRAVAGLPAAVLTRVKMPLGMEELTPRDLKLRPMELRIKHAVRSQNDTWRPGQYQLGKRLFDTPEVIFLRVHKFQQLNEGEGEDTHAVCGSADSWVPLPDLRAPKAKRCHEPTMGGDQRPVCPYAQFDRDPTTGKATAPACTQGVAFMGLLVEGVQVSPFWFPTRKTAAWAMLQFLADLGNIDGLFQFRVRLATQENRSKHGGGVVWYTPVPTVAETFEGEMHNACRRLAEQVQELRYTPWVRDDSTLEPGEPEAEGDAIPTTGRRVDGGPAPVPASDLGVPFVFPGELPEPFVRV